MLSLKGTGFHAYCKPLRMHHTESFALASAKNEMCDRRPRDIMPMAMFEHAHNSPETSHDPYAKTLGIICLEFKVWCPKTTGHNARHVLRKHL